MQELKKNQELQEYLRLLENKIHQPKREGAADKQVSSSVAAGFRLRVHSSWVEASTRCFVLRCVLKAHSTGVISCIGGNHAGGPNLLPSHASGHGPSSCFSPPSPDPEAGWREEGQSSGGARQGASGDSRQEVQDLKEQLEALRCQVGPSHPRPHPHTI